ncbi:MAG: M48 family metalloprotease [Treponema sp.]|jgi:predicted Zn-dependent protease|nr:M48 family metalloprotease [Treponema sp.]
MNKKLTAIVVALILFQSICFAQKSPFKNLKEKIQLDQKTRESAKKTSEALGKAQEDISPEEEYYIGRAVAARLLSQYKPLKNEKLQTYLNKICYTLVINSNKPDVFNGYRVMVLDSDEANAFATPGGHILVTKGLIKCTENEDALAAVIAHEIAHIQLQHAVKAIKSKRTRAALTSAAKTTTYALGSDALNEMVDSFDENIGEIVSTMTTAGYSKQQEFDADNTALKLLEGAGYDPHGLEMMLKMLQKNKSSKGGMYSTHPSPESRLNNVTMRLGKYQYVSNQDVRLSRYNAAVSGL